MPLTIEPGVSKEAADTFLIMIAMMDGLSSIEALTTACNLVARIILVSSDSLEDATDTLIRMSADTLDNMMKNWPNIVNERKATR